MKQANNGKRKPYTTMKNQKFVTRKGVKEASHEKPKNPDRWNESSRRRSKQPTHDSCYMYKEETLDSRYQVKEQTCDSPYAEKQLTTSIVITRM